jgi:hypothetical protein
LSFTSTIRDTETAPAAVGAITAEAAPKSQLVTSDPKRLEYVKDARGRMKAEGGQWDFENMCWDKRE